MAQVLVAKNRDSDPDGLTSYTRLCFGGERIEGLKRRRRTRMPSGVLRLYAVKGRFAFKFEGRRGVQLCEERRTHFPPFTPRPATSAVGPLKGSLTCANPSTGSSLQRGQRCFTSSVIGECGGPTNGIQNSAAAQR